MSQMYSAELVCKQRCGYEAAVGSAYYSGYKRAQRDTCPRCGAGVTSLGGASA